MKQRFPPNSGGSEEVAFRMKRGGADRNSKIGLLDAGKENGLGGGGISGVGVGIPQQLHAQQQQPMLPPTARVKHSSPRLQMGTGVLTVSRPHATPQNNVGDIDEAGYEAPGKLVSKLINAPIDVVDNFT